MEYSGWVLPIISLSIHTNYFLHWNKDNINTNSAPNEALDDLLDTPPFRVDDPELDQSTDKETDDEIIEESALDHFNAILQKAQQISAQAERERRKSCKRPSTYSGKSKRTLKQHKQFKDNLEWKGFLSVFNFIAFTKKKKHPLESEQAQCTAVDSDKIQTDQALKEEGEEVEVEEVEEEVEEEKEDVGGWTFQWMNKVHRITLLRCTDWWGRNLANSQRRGWGKHSWNVWLKQRQ